MSTVPVNGIKTSTDRAVQLLSSQPVGQRQTRAASHKVENQRLRRSMNSKSLSAPKPLTSADGNRCKSSRAKPSDKEKENNAQREDGLVVLNDGTVSGMDWAEVIDTSEENTQQLSSEQYLRAIYLQNMDIKQRQSETSQVLTHANQSTEPSILRVHANQSTGPSIMQVHADKSTDWRASIGTQFSRLIRESVVHAVQSEHIRSAAYWRLKCDTTCRAYETAY